MIILIHGNCGKPAFWVDPAQLAYGARIDSSLAAHLDGTRIFAGEPMACDSCGRRVQTTDLYLG